MEVKKTDGLPEAQPCVSAESFALALCWNEKEERQ
jgi:hypothetical protein